MNDFVYFGAFCFLVRFTRLLYFDIEVSGGSGDVEMSWGLNEERCAFVFLARVRANAAEYRSHGLKTRATGAHFFPSPCFTTISRSTSFTSNFSFLGSPLGQVTSIESTFSALPNPK